MSRRSAPPRHVSRRAALQVLYAQDLSGGSADGEPVPVDDALERIAEHFDLHEGARAFAEQLARGVSLHRDAIDARIARHARNWRLERMAAVDRNVLRLAVFELCHTETPDRVVIDEAIELARDFGAERSPGFVNGVLDSIARELREDPAAAPAAPGSPS